MGPTIQLSVDCDIPGSSQTIKSVTIATKAIAVVEAGYYGAIIRLLDGTKYSTRLSASEVLGRIERAEAAGKRTSRTSRA